MVNAVLHIICGNCGCNNLFTYSIGYFINDDNETEGEIQIKCNNCSTIHFIEVDSDD